MELILVCGVLLSLLVIVVSLLPYFLSTHKHHHNDPKLLPPGKTGWPVIGESIEFLCNMQNCYLEKFTFIRTAKYSPDVFKTSILGDHVAMICGPSGSKFLFSKGNKLVKRWVVRPVQLIFAHDHSFDRLNETFDQCIKPAIVRFLKLDGLKCFVGVMDAMTQHHLESHWDGVQVITVLPSVKRYTFTLACRLLMSIEDPDIVKSLFESMEALSLGTHSMPINLPGTQMNRSIKAVAILRSRILQIVKRQRSMESSSDTVEKNLISCLLHASPNDEDVTHGVLGLLFAGHETVASVISMIFKVITDNSQVYDRVYKENMEMETQGKLLSWDDIHTMRYTWNVALEIIRLYPPVQFLMREAITDFTYAGYHIPQGYKLITNLHAIHKDPNYFPKPVEFDPSRFDGDGPLPYTYIPFGGGRSSCPGMNYAQILILVFIHNVVNRYKWDAVIADEKVIGIPFPQPSQGFPIILHPHAH